MEPNLSGPYDEVINKFRAKILLFETETVMEKMISK
jgi:hypothetical protein